MLSSIHFTFSAHLKIGIILFSAQLKKMACTRLRCAAPALTTRKTYSLDRAAASCAGSRLHRARVGTMHLELSSRRMASGISQRLHFHVQGSPYHTSCVKTPSLFLWPRLCWHACRLECASHLHTQEVVARPAEPKSSGKSGEHGSVLAQFSGREKEPKQITVAGKGQLH